MIEASTPKPSLLVVATLAHTIGAFLLPITSHFRDLGWRVDAAGSGMAGEAACQAAFDGRYDISLSRSILDVRGMARTEQELAHLIEETRPDIVHVHTPIAGFVTRLAVRRTPAAHRPKVVYTAHGFHFFPGGNPLTNGVFLTAERVAGRWTDRLVVINHEDQLAARRHHIVAASRLTWSPGIGVDTRFWAPGEVSDDERAAVRDRFGVDAGAPLFVYMGEMNANKRQLDVLRALAAMHRRDAHLVLIGHGPYRQRLEAAVDDLGLASRVHFTGHLQVVRPIVAAADALVLASRREGLARSVMEALSLEVPVIASTARGNRELVGDDAGIMVDVGDVAGFTAALDRLAASPDERREMGRRGRARMVGQFDDRIVVALHEEIYAGLLGER